MTPRVLSAALLLATACTGAQAGSFRSPAVGAHPGGTLTVGITPPGSIDPGNDYEPSGDLIVRTMCDSLLTTDPRDGRLRPGLAESWVVTDNGAKVVLRLRKGLRFSDGTPLTGSDVEYTLSRVAAADFASAAADKLRLIDGFAQVHGDVETSDDTARRRLSGVRSADKRSVEISLTRPYADFVRVLATRLTAPVSRRAADADPEAFARQPVCAGPYRLAEPFVPGATALRLVRSKAYTPADSGLTLGGRGFADEVRFRIYPTDTAAAAAAARGDVDVAPAAAQDTAQVAAGPGPEIEYVGLPATTPPFDRTAVRRALAIALSRTELVRRVFPRTREPATGFLPPTTGAARSCDALPPDGDAAAAGRALAAAGVDLRGVRVPLLFNDELRNRALVTEVARQWREVVGLVAVPTPMTYSSFLAQGRGTRGFAAPFRFSWAADDVEGYLTPLFSAGAVGQDNLSRFSDPTVDEALTRRAWRAIDPADRALAYRRVADLLCADMPMIPLTTRLQRYTVAASVGSAAGRFVDGSTGQPLLREMYLR